MVEIRQSDDHLFDLHNEISYTDEIASLFSIVSQYVYADRMSYDLLVKDTKACRFIFHYKYWTDGLHTREQAGYFIC